MVDTIKELKEEIAKLKAVKTREVKREKLEVEEMKLRKELKSLKLTPRQRAIQKVAIKIGKGISKQAKLIQDQQARERAEAVARGDEVKKTASGVTLVRKKPIPKQLKKFAFKKKNTKAKKERKTPKRKRKQTQENDGGFGMPSFDF